MLIEKTYAAGGMVHLWMWGDEERGQTPSARDDWGGLDGPVARKVERAIAERLGPLSGWSLGYGFDLDEWVEASEIHAWRDRMHRVLPSPRFMGGRPQGPNNGKNHRRYRRWKNMVKCTLSKARKDIDVYKMHYAQNYQHLPHLCAQKLDRLS